MKTKKKYCIALSFLFMLSIFTNSSFTYADGAPIAPSIVISNATLNGIPFSLGCGSLVSFPANSHLEFDILLHIYDEQASLSYSFNPPSPPGAPIFTPSLPRNFVQLPDVVIHFSWISPTQYLGLLNLLASDCCSQTQCRLDFDIALPVELSSFVSSINGNDVILNWTTSSETNNSGFDVERSLVNGEWSMVNFVSGHGNSNILQNYSYEDRNLSSEKFNYRLKQIDFNGNFEYFNLSNEVVIGVPANFELSQNYPNPFNPKTVISYQLAHSGDVSLKLYDINGKEILTLVKENKTAGYYEITVDGSNFASGIYYYRLKLEGNGNNFVSTKKMMLLK